MLGHRKAMADNKSKPDWTSLAAEFLKLQKSNGMKIKDFAALKGLNENSARRGIGQAIKQIEAGNSDHNNSDQKANKKNDKKAGKTADQNAGKRGRPRKSKEGEKPDTARDTAENEDGTDGLAHADSGAPDGDQNGAKRSSQPKKNGDQKSDQKKGKKPSLEVITGEVITLHKNKGGAPKGNDNGLSTGRKKRVRQQDIDAAMKTMKQFSLPKGWQKTIEGEMVKELLGHYHLTKRARDKSLRRLLGDELEEAEAIDVPIQEGEGRTVNLTPSEFKQLKMLTDTGYALNDTVRTISQILTNLEKEQRAASLHQLKLEDTQAKIRQAQEAHELRLYGKMQGAVIQEAMQMLQGEDGSAIRAAQHLEARGIALPATISRLMEIELAKEREKIDETGGMTPEELDAYVAAAEAKRAGRHQWLAEKRAAVAEVVDKFGYGDLDEDGTRRSDEIQAAFQPGEEIDLSATADLYGDAPAAPNMPEDDDDTVPEKEDASLWQGENDFDEDDDPDEEIKDWQGDN